MAAVTRLPITTWYDDTQEPVEPVCMCRSKKILIPKIPLQSKQQAATGQTTRWRSGFAFDDAPPTMMTPTTSLQ